MAKERTSIYIAPWVLEQARTHAEKHGMSVSALIERGILREIAASHDPRARAALYGPPAVAGQETDEQITAEDITRTAEDRRPGEAA